MAYEPRQRGDSGHDEIRRCVGSLEASLRDLARALAHDVIAAELDRRLRRAAVATREARPTRSTGSTRPTGSTRSAVDRDAAPAPPAASAAAAPASFAAGKRMRWTREAVIAELCEWLISGIVEPAFLRRHGKPGLVTAATRIFGRFDSALNVANLYLAKQYPEGPPAKRGAPAMHGRAIAKGRPVERAPSHDEAARDAAGEPATGDAADAAPAIEPLPGDAAVPRDEPALAPRPH